MYIKCFKIKASNKSTVFNRSYKNCIIVTTDINIY